MPDSIPMEKVRSVLLELEDGFDQSILPIKSYAEVLCAAHEYEAMTISQLQAGTVLQALLKWADNHFEEALRKTRLTGKETADNGCIITQSEKPSVSI